jgi:hypothetical protein
VPISFKAPKACRLSIGYRQRLLNFSFFGMRQHRFHSVKNGLILKFLHTSNVVWTAGKPIDHRRSVKTKQAGHITAQAKRRRVRGQY